MNTVRPSAQLAVAFCRWLLARFGLEFTPVAKGTASALFYRDRRGRFMSLERASSTGTWGPSRVGEGEVPDEIAELLSDLGVTAEMYRTAAVPLTLPADLTDIAALELCLREWILRNMDHWVNGRNRSVYPVFCALQRTFALAWYRFRPPRRFVRGAYASCAPDAVRGAADSLSAYGATLGNAADFAAVPTASSSDFDWNTELAQGNGLDYHRVTESTEQDKEFLSSSAVSRCLGGENQQAIAGNISIAVTAAGGHKVRPYFSDRIPPETPRDPNPETRDPCSQRGPPRLIPPLPIAH